MFAKLCFFLIQHKAKKSIDENVANSKDFSISKNNGHFTIFNVQIAKYYMNVENSRLM